MWGMFRPITHWIYPTRLSWDEKKKPAQSKRALCFGFLWAHNPCSFLLHDASWFHPPLYGGAVYIFFFFLILNTPSLFFNTSPMLCFNHFSILQFNKPYFNLFFSKFFLGTSKGIIFNLFDDKVRVFSQ